MISSFLLFPQGKKTGKQNPAEIERSMQGSSDRTGPKQNLPGARRRDRGFLKAEVGQLGLTLRSGSKDDLAGFCCGHSDTSGLCCVRGRRCTKSAGDIIGP
jgi:hypothetical protein